MTRWAPEAVHPRPDPHWIDGFPLHWCPWGDMCWRYYNPALRILAIWLHKLTFPSVGIRGERVMEWDPHRRPGHSDSDIRLLGREQGEGHGEQFAFWADICPKAAENGSAFGAHKMNAVDDLKHQSRPYRGNVPCPPNVHSRAVGIALSTRYVSKEVLPQARLEALSHILLGTSPTERLLNFVRTFCTTCRSHLQK